MVEILGRLGFASVTVRTQARTAKAGEQDDPAPRAEQRQELPGVTSFSK